MLTWSCRRFRARFSPGSGTGSAHPHRRACRECGAYAAALESAAGVRLPVPVSLRRNLRAIADPGPRAVLPFAVPRLPVPDGLTARLRDLASSSAAAPSRPALPEWARSPRYAIAASALLALLLGPFLADAAHRGRQALDAVQEEVIPVLQRTGESGREEAGKLRSTAATACDAARRSVEDSLQRLDHGFSSLSTRLSDATSQRFINLDLRHEPAGSVRRP
jgi:hypothetical protein